MCCNQLRDLPLDLSQPITDSLASQYLTSSVIRGGPIYSVKMLRSTALVMEFIVFYVWIFIYISSKIYLWKRKIIEECVWSLLTLKVICYVWDRPTHDCLNTFSWLSCVFFLHFFWISYKYLITFLLISQDFLKTFPWLFHKEASKSDGLRQTKKEVRKYFTFRN